MKTYSQFIQDIQERYYEPDEKLKSGKTPVQKATQKSRTRARTIGSQSPDNQERWGKQYDRTQTKVKHGADNPKMNPNVSFKDKDDVKVDSNDDEMDIYHKPSGVYYNVRKSDDSRYDDVRTVEWGHDKQKEKTKLSPVERLKTARNAKRVWDQHVSPRLPKGSIVHNTPQSSIDDKGKIKPINRRAEIYKKAGFGETDDEGDQFAKVEREPSPKQKAKGKSRLKPLNARRTKVDVEWGKEDDDDPSVYDD
jgi:hypothetical protein